MIRCSCTSSSPEPCHFCAARDAAVERRMEEIASNQGFRLMAADDEELQAIRSVAEIGFDRWLKAQVAP